MVTIGKIPVYNAVLGEECGMMRISLVDDPAVMSNFQAFDATRPMMLYRVADDEQRKVLGVVMRADFPIYRRNEDMGEFYIIYDRKTIEEMAQKYLAEGRANNVNIMHEENTDVEGVEMVQYFIKDSAKGIAPEGFDEVADGSLFAEFKVENDTIWDAIKEGTYRGFSLEGYFDLVPSEDKDGVAKIVDDLEGKFKRLFKNKKDMNKKIMQILTAMAKACAVEFKAATTDKGIINWDSDDDLKAGDEVFALDEDGNKAAIADGEYTTEDGKVIVVVESKVAEIKDAEAEVAPEDAPAEEEAKKKKCGMAEETPEEEKPAEEPKADYEERLKAVETLVAKIAEYIGIVVVPSPIAEQMSALKAEIDALKNAPAAEPAHMEFKKVDNPAAYGANENLVRILNAR